MTVERWRHACRGARQLRAVVGLVLFAAQFVLLDLVLRGAHRYAAEPSALCAAFASVALWGLAGAFARGRVTRSAVALLAASVFVCELLFFRYYHVFLGARAIASALSSWRDVRAVVRGMLPSAALAALLLSLVEYRMLRSAPKLTLAHALGLALCLPLAGLTRSQAIATPDLTALAGLSVLLRAHEVKVAATLSVPPLESGLERLPNVLFILTESVSARDYMSPELTVAAPLTQQLSAGRVDFRQARSVASYTAVAVNALLSGRMPLGTRAEVAATPLLFDLVRAVRLAERAPKVLYWSGQDDSWLERTNTHALADSVAFSDDVLGHHVETLEEVLEYGIDGKLADYVDWHLTPAERPLFLVVHMAGTHAPYFVDPKRALFRPYSHVVTWSGLRELHNAYLNALIEQDRAVASILQTFLRVVADQPYLIVFTSDHGESFGEHHSIHHGQDLYDEQIHVPVWIAHGHGALGPEAAATLRSHAGDFVTHLDLLPTLLDALGVLDSFGMKAMQSPLPGRSLLRAFTTRSSPLAVTNCTALFPCPLPNFGVLDGRYELLAQPWDDDWHCVDLAAQNAELSPADPICGALRRTARGVYKELPNGRALR